jgi:hypothetical protein
MYDDILSVVLEWGVSRFTSFIEDCRIRRAEKQDLTPFESRSLICATSLGQAVRLYEDASDMMFTMESDAQRKAAPLPWHLGASEYAKQVPVFCWNGRQGKFDEYPLERWLDDGKYLTTSLLMLGPAAAGKSKCLHMLCAEITVASGASTYCYGKALDPLGVLSHAGQLRACKALALTDFDFASSRGKSMSSESLKGLFDALEGGTLKDTRWRAAVLPAGLARLCALNGDEAGYGRWFERHEQLGLSVMVEKLSQMTDPRTTEMERWALKAEAVKLMKGLSADDQATARRVAVCFCRDTMITGDALAALEEGTEAQAADARKRRAAYWLERAA